MYQFKKTDTKELDKSISVVLACILVGMAIFYLLQVFMIVDFGRIFAPEVVVVIGSLILVMFDIMYLMQKENRHLKKWDLVLLGFAASIIISTIFSQNAALSLSGNDLTSESTTVMLCYVVIAFSASLVAEKSSKKIIYAATVIFGLIQVIMGLLHTVIRVPFVDYYFELQGMLDMRRAFGTTNNPNPYGSIMVLLAGIESALFVGSVKNIKAVFHGVMAVLYIISIFLSGTRGAMLGFFTSALICTVYVLVISKKSEHKKTYLFHLGIVIAGAIAAMIIFFASGLAGDAIDRTKGDIANNAIGEERLLKWDEAVKRYVTKYPVAGVGVSNVSFVNILHDYETGEISGFRMTTDVHNRYLNILSTQGIIGLVTYLIIIIYVLMYAFKKIRKDGLDDNIPLLGLILSIIGYLIADIFCIGQFIMVTCFFMTIGMVVDRKDLPSIKIRK